MQKLTQHWSKISITWLSTFNYLIINHQIQQNIRLVHQIFDTWTVSFLLVHWFFIDFGVSVTPFFFFKFLHHFMNGISFNENRKALSFSGFDNSPKTVPFLVKSNNMVLQAKWSFWCMIKLEKKGMTMKRNRSRPTTNKTAKSFLISTWDVAILCWKVLPFDWISLYGEFWYGMCGSKSNNDN